MEMTKSNVARPLSPSCACSNDNCATAQKASAASSPRNPTQRELQQRPGGQQRHIISPHHLGSVTGDSDSSTSAVGVSDNQKRVFRASSRSPCSFRCQPEPHQRFRQGVHKTRIYKYKLLLKRFVGNLCRHTGFHMILEVHGHWACRHS